MDFYLSEEQQAYIASARAFSAGVLAPGAALWDAQCIFPKDALRQAGELGFMGMYTPEKADGLGLSRFDASLIVEELARGCTATTAFITIHNMATGMVGKYCSEAVIEQWCSRLVTGELLASYCLTEPGAGSDAGGAAYQRGARRRRLHRQRRQDFYLGCRRDRCTGRDVAHRRCRSQRHFRIADSRRLARYHLRQARRENGLERAPHTHHQLR